MEEIKIPFSEFNFSFSRSGGAGGQNVNKVNSKVTLRWRFQETQSCSLAVLERFANKFGQYILDSGEVQLTCQTHRSQKANIDECVSKIHEMINSVRKAPKIRKATKPKRSAVLKRLSTKKKDSEKKQLRRKEY